MRLTTEQWPIFAFPAALIAVFMLVMRSVKRGSTDARTAALARGLEVSDVQRPLPTRNDRGLRQQWELVEGRCTRYALRLPRGGGAGWALLMRPGAVAPTLAPAWELVEPREGLPPALRRVLEEIAADWTEEYLELEGEPDCVVAYWEEQGGDAMVSRIHGYLARCAAASV